MRICPRNPRAALPLALLGALHFQTAAPASAQDPFQPGLRWRAPASAALPAIPRGVSFSAFDGVVWAASNGPHPGFAALSAFGSGTVAPLHAAGAPAGATGSMAVAASRAGEVLFALAQVPAPDDLHRATIVTRWSAAAAAAGATFAPLWTFDPGLRANGPARIGCDAAGTRVFAAAWNGPLPEVRVDALDALTGQSLAHALLPAAALNEMSVAADGTRVALACGLDLWIVDASCAVVDHRTLVQSTPAVSTSGDGARIAFGGASVRVLAAGPGGYATAFDVAGAASELATRVALSADGRTLAIGWWNASTGADVRFDVWDVPSQTRLFQTAQHGVAGGLQNAPEVVRATADGARAAFGCWGDGTSTPELLVWDRATNAIVLQADLPGSVFALDLDATGTKVAVGMKAAHANQFAGTGEFRLYSTGEKELTVLAPAHAGGSLDLAAKRPGATGVIFLDGTPSPFPLNVPGVSGTLLLRRVGIRPVRVRTDATGRADVSIPLANDPALIGTYKHVQVAFRVGGSLVLGPTLVHAVIL